MKHKEKLTDCNLPEPKYLTKKEFEEGKQGIIEWNISEDVLHFSCGNKIKVNRQN